MKRFKLILLVLLCGMVIASCSLLGSGGNNDGGDKKEPDITRPIVFAATDSAGTSQIFAMKADGSELKQLTHFDGTGSSSQPTWSPGGKQVIFNSSKLSTTRGPALWIIEADGSNSRPLMYNGSPLVGDNADWSPDGKKIVFDFCTECEISTRDDIYTYNLETNQLTRLTDKSQEGSNRYPEWSPDGKQIAFITNRDYVNTDSLHSSLDLYVMNADGSNPQRVTETGSAVWPVWNPDGEKIAFRQHPQGLFEIDFQSGVTSLLKKDISENIRLQPHAWSEDGYKLLLTSLEIPPPGDQILHIYNTRDSSLTDLITKLFDGSGGINGVDWLWEKKNPNN